jgi:hypothetical protein
MYDAFNDRFNNPAAGIALQIIPIAASFFCLVATTTYVSRCAAQRHATHHYRCRGPCLGELCASSSPRAPLHRALRPAADLVHPLRSHTTPE